MTTPFCTSSCRRTLTNWPGQRRVVSLGKRAFMRIVPVVWSITLSVVISSPWPSTVRSSGVWAVTGRVPRAIASWMAGRLSCGRVKTTTTGLIWLMVTMMALSLAKRTTLPGSTLRRPIRPSKGAVMLV